MVRLYLYNLYKLYKLYNLYNLCKLYKYKNRSMNSIDEDIIILYNKRTKKRTKISTK